MSGVLVAVQAMLQNTIQMQQPNAANNKLHRQNKESCRMTPIMDYRAC